MSYAGQTNWQGPAEWGGPGKGDNLVLMWPHHIMSELEEILETTDLQLSKPRLREGKEFV